MHYAFIIFIPHHLSFAHCSCGSAPITTLLKLFKDYRPAKICRMCKRTVTASNLISFCSNIHNATIGGCSSTICATCFVILINCWTWLERRVCVTNMYKSFIHQVAGKSFLPHMKKDYISKIALVLVVMAHVAHAVEWDCQRFFSLLCGIVYLFLFYGHSVLQIKCHPRLLWWRFTNFRRQRKSVKFCLLFG